MCTSGALRSESQVVGVGALEHHEEPAAVGQVGQRGESRLGRGLVARDQAVDHVDPLVAGPVGEGTAQGGGLHLLGGALVVAARLRAVDDATAGELRRADRALAGAAGALLLVGLAATAADLAAGLGGVGALARGRLLGDDDLVDQRDVDLDVEDLGGQVDLHGLGSHLGQPSWLFAAVRSHDQAALGAGHGALDQDQALLGVDRVHGEVLGGDGVGTHPAGHPDALEHATGGGAGADRARLAVVAVGTVGGADAVEAVPLHDTGEALALAGAGHVDDLAGLEGVDRRAPGRRCTPTRQRCGSRPGGGAGWCRPCAKWPACGLVTLRPSISPNPTWMAL